MKKTFRMMLTLALVMLGAMNVSAGELISLQEVPFWQHSDAWGLQEAKTSKAECAWVLDESTGQPYGDTSVKNFADLSLYATLVVTVTDGTPRFLFNRDVDEGQWDADEANSHLIDNTKGGWSSKYFSSAAGENEGETVYTVDLKQLNSDKGFAHLHAIKGANWQNVTVTSMMVERSGKAQQVGWTSIINNGDFESDDISSFAVALDAVHDPGVHDIEITDGVGVNGSRGLIVTTLAGATEDWATQLFVKLGETLPEGTKWRFTMDVKADLDATVTSGSHKAPREWFDGGIIPEFSVNTEWTTVSAEGVSTAKMVDLGSIAFDLNRDRDNENNFYFDNINFEVFKLGTVAEFYMDHIQIDFGFDTNIPELVAASGKMRLDFPKSCVKVNVNGVVLGEDDILSVEGYADGRFYIFLVEPLDDTANVNVTFINPKDEACHLIYRSGVEGDVADYDGPADFNGDLDEGHDDVYAYVYAIPTLMSADPEDGSFNLPNSIAEFTLTFDKPVDCTKVKAQLNDIPLTVVPSEGAAEVITLVRSTETQVELPTGEYILHVSDIYPEIDIFESPLSYDITLNVGKMEYDPADQPYDVVPVDYFANCAAGGIPEGYLVNFNGEERVAPSTYGSGSRMFDFTAGGDFTKGLYFREGFVEYGSLEGYKVALQAGKKYAFSFKSAMWKDNGSKVRFEIIEPTGASVYTAVIDNTPNVNGSTAAVNGCTQTSFYFFPENDGEYLLKWTSSGSETGDPVYMEILLADVCVKYTPNQVGLEETLLLETALENAISTLRANEGERYAGEAYDALEAAIGKYQTEKEGYTAPSAFKNAAADLDAKSQAMKDHRANCDGYDEQIKKAIDVARQNKENKFAKTDLYAELSEIVAKYHGSSEWVNVNADVEPTIDPETGEEIVPEEKWELVYSYDVLTDDAQLIPAIDELKTIANTTSLMFTEGASACSNTGVKVLIERIRLGAEDLKALGVSEDNEPIFEEANNALTDDDELVARMKTMAKAAIYGQLKDADNEMFKPTVDEETLEETYPAYDVTVFVKNPNIYKLSDKMDFTEEAVPGWTTPEGYNRPGLSCGWGASQGTSVIAEDCMFQTWNGSYRVEQEITDLPVGVYTIKFGFGEREVQNETKGQAYANDSEGLEYAIEAPYIGQSFPVQNISIEEVTVTDGILTIGVEAYDGSHTFFNDVRVLMTAPAAGMDYAALYDKVVTGVETLTTAQKSATIRFIELYDLNGRRITSAQKGVQLVKKFMSDGTVRTEKVIKK